MSSTGIPTNVFSINFNLAASAHQPELVQQLKTRGDEVIQTSSGLCVKTSMTESELKEFVGAAGAGITVQKLDLSSQGDLPKDVLAFIGVKVTSVLLAISTAALAASLLFSTVTAHAYESEGQKFDLKVLTEQKDVIWGFDFLPDGKILFTERMGKLKTFDPKTKAVVEIKGAPQVWTDGQGGLLDVRVHPKDPTKIYLSYAEPVGKKEAVTALGVATLDGTELKNFKKLFTAKNASSEEIHFGSRIEFDGKGHLFATIGERNARDNAQSLEFTTGKLIRLNEDGSVPKDNPFAVQKGAQPEIWSRGHRSNQGLAMNFETGDLWEAEMGPRGGDEINLIKRGANYGWAVATYGREYWGPKIGDGPTKPGMEDPIAFWVPSISPSAIAFYTGTQFPKWKGNLFVACLSGQHLRRLVIEGQKVVKQEELLKDRDLRFRNVRTGPDGLLYVSTDDGKIARLEPAASAAVSK